MKKSDAVKIEKAFLRLHCPHNEWKYAGVFVYGSFRSTIVECKECGKRVKWVKGVNSMLMNEN